MSNGALDEVGVREDDDLLGYHGDGEGGKVIVFAAVLC